MGLDTTTQLRICRARMLPCEVSTCLATSALALRTLRTYITLRVERPFYRTGSSDPGSIQEQGTHKKKHCERTARKASLIRKYSKGVRSCHQHAAKRCADYTSQISDMSLPATRCEHDGVLKTLITSTAAMKPKALPQEKSFHCHLNTVRQAEQDCYTSQRSKISHTLCNAEHGGATKPASQELQANQPANPPPERL